MNRQQERKERHRLYTSARWQALRRKVLVQHPHCARCGAAASVVDHVAGHGDDWRERFFNGPFTALCARCHNTKTATVDCVANGGRLRSMQYLPGMKQRLALGATGQGANNGGGESTNLALHARTAPGPTEKYSGGVSNRSPNEKADLLTMLALCVINSRKSQ